MGRLGIAFLLLGIPVLAGLGYGLTQDLGRHRALIEPVIAHYLDDEARIEGAIRMRPTFDGRIRLAASDLVLGDEALVAGTAIFKVSPLNILLPRSGTAAVELRDVRVANREWVDRTIRRVSAQEGLRIDRIDLEDLLIEFLPFRLADLYDVALRHLTIEPHTDGLDFSAVGKGGFAALEVKGTLGILSHVEEGTAPLSVIVRHGEALAEMTGHVSRDETAAMPLTASVFVPHPELLGSGFGPLRRLYGPLSFDGTFDLGQGLLTIETGRAQIGRGDYRLAGALDFDGKRPEVSVQVTSDFADFDALGPAAPQPSPAEPAEEGASRGVALEGLFFGDAAPVIGGVVAFDFSGGILGGAVFDSMTGTATLTDETLALSDMALRQGATEVKADAIVLRAANPKAALRLRADNPVSSGLLSAIGLGPEAGVRAPLTASVDLKTEGQSFEAWQRALNGEVQVAVGPGLVFQDTLRTLSNDLAETLLAAGLARDGAPFVFQCGLSSVTIERGLARTDLSFFRLSSGILSADGELDLAEGTLEAVLAPRPWDPEVLRSVKDIEVKGPLSAPAFQAQSRTRLQGGLRGMAGLVTGGSVDEVFDLIDPLALETNRCTEDFPRRVAPSGRAISGATVDAIFD
ncbi:MAG: AsmA-like C-terminal region-containing protein [Pseudomonadota bacterium]